MTAFFTMTAIALGAPALKDKPKSDTIVGEWTAQEIIAGGRPCAVKAETVVWVFKEDGTREIRREGKLAFSGRFIDDPKCSPATLDLDRNPKGEADYLCIYKIDGDTLTLNVGWQKVARPGEFTSPEGSQHTLYRFKRVKSKD